VREVVTRYTGPSGKPTLSGAASRLLDQWARGLWNAPRPVRLRAGDDIGRLRTAIDHDGRLDLLAASLPIDGRGRIGGIARRIAAVWRWKIEEWESEGERTKEAMAEEESIAIAEEESIATAEEEAIVTAEEEAIVTAEEERPVGEPIVEQHDQADYMSAHRRSP
jgi:hypothetical protein